MKRGFTLVELLGVIVLIAALVLIAVPAVNNSLKKGKTNADEQFEENVIVASKLWAQDHKEALAQLKEAGDFIYQPSLNDLQEGGYLDKDIKVPSTNTDVTQICVRISLVNKNTKKYRYKYTDNLNCNASTDLIIVGKIGDTIIPSMDKDDAWTNSNVILSIQKNMTEDAKNIKYVDGTNSNSIKQSCTDGDYNCPYTVNCDNNKVCTSSYRLTYEYSKDNAKGHSETFAVKIDKEKPTVTITPNEDTTYTKTKTPTIKISDNKGSGLKANQKIYYAWSTSPKKSPNDYNSYVTTTNKDGESSTTVDVNSPSDVTGEYYLWIKAGISDMIGNTSESVTSKVFKLDNTAPTCNWSGESTTWAKSRTIKINVTDEHSGIDRSYKTTEWKITETNKTKYLSYTVKDKAGNTTTCEKTANVYVDVTAPSCGTTSQSGVSTSVTGYVDCSDNESGCTNNTFSGTYTSNGTKTITIKDNVGNTNDCSISITNIQNLPSLVWNYYGNTSDGDVCCYNRCKNSSGICYYAYWTAYPNGSTITSDSYMYGTIPGVGTFIRYYDDTSMYYFGAYWSYSSWYLSRSTGDWQSGAMAKLCTTAGCTGEV